MGMDKAEVSSLTSRILTSRSSQPMVLNYNGQDFKIDLSSLSDQATGEQIVDNALEYGRKRFYYKKAYLNLPFSLNEQIKSQLKEISTKVNQAPVEAKLDFDEDQIKITPSKTGLKLDEVALNLLIAQYINTGRLTSYQLPVITEEPIISTETALAVKQTLEEIKLEPIKLTFKDMIFKLDYTTLLGLLDLKRTRQHLLDTESLQITDITIGDKIYSDRQFLLDQQKLDEYLTKISVDINQEVQEPVFKYENNRVLEFIAPQEGRQLDIEVAAALINQALRSNTQVKEVALPVSVVLPKDQLVNDLGIKENLGQGFSRFAGSIANRIYNVGLAASRINGVLIPPGETFSFNQSVGDISAASGYKQAYVIKSGKTELDDGGGVCQVSTTLFRAVLNAGLPIVSRTAHAYRVGYYEQGFPPGIDATIFQPSVDFKFKNDTGKHILIQTETVGTTLTINLYGTPDGRLAVLSTPVISSSTPPPPEIRQDDPTLPKGTVKQVEHAAWGAKVSFKRTVTRGGVELINETFYSNYKAWANAYLVGTKEI